MEKTLEMGRASATGSFQLFVGKMLSTVIMAVGTIILTVFILEGDYGLYAVALIPTATISLLQDWGVGSALTKKCAYCRATNQAGELRRVIVAGITFEVSTGLILTFVSILMANFLAFTVFDKPQSAFLITIASVTILFSGLLMASQSVFVGFDRMGLSSLTMICQAVIQGVLSPLLVFLGYGALGAILGYTFSTVGASMIALAMLHFAILRKLSPKKIDKSIIIQTLKPLLAYGVPLAIAGIMAGILPQFYSFLMASFVDLATIGNFRTATNFAILLTFFAFPISTALFPAFSKLDHQNEPGLLKTVFRSSVKYAALLLVPATLAMMVLAQPIIGTLYGGKWLDAPIFLALYVVIYLFAIFGNLSLGSLLTGLGETKMMMKLNALTLFIGIPLAFLLIPLFGVIGLIIVSIVAGIPSLFIGLLWIRNRYGTEIDLGASARIFLASLVAASATYLLLNVLNAVSWIQLATGTVVFLAIYLTFAPLIGAINQSDVNSLRAMFSGLGVVSRMLEIPLLLIQKILDARSNSGKLLSTTTQNTPS